MRYAIKTRFLLGALIGLGGLYCATTLLYAQPPGRLREFLQTEENAEMISGRVEKLLKNDHGDIDGLLLDDGLQVHFPPHLGRAVTKLISAGDEVSVHGRQETLPRGEVVFEASQIESQGETIMVDRPAPPRGPKGKGKGKGPGGFERPMEAAGVVEDYAFNPHNDIDGLILNDETVVKFPPHLGAALQEMVQVGDEVRVTGRRHETPHGDVHLHADRIVAVGTGKALDRDGPDVRRPAAGRIPAPDQEPTNAEIMHELRKLRDEVQRLQAR